MILYFSLFERKKDIVSDVIHTSLLLSERYEKTKSSSPLQQMSSAGDDKVLGPKWTPLNITQLHGTPLRRGEEKISPVMIAAGYVCKDFTTSCDAEQEAFEMCEKYGPPAMIYYLVNFSRTYASKKMLRLCKKTRIIRDGLVECYKLGDSRYISAEMWRYGDYEKCKMLCILCHDLMLWQRNSKVLDIMRAVAQTISDINHLHPVFCLTPLMVASMNLFPEAVEDLLEYGADPRIVTTYTLGDYSDEKEWSSQSNDTDDGDGTDDGSSSSPSGDDTNDNTLVREKTNALNLAMFWWRTKAFEGYYPTSTDSCRAEVVYALIKGGCDANSVLCADGQTVYQYILNKDGFVQFPTYPHTRNVFFDYVDPNVIGNPPHYLSPFAMTLVKYCSNENIMVFRVSLSKILSKYNNLCSYAYVDMLRTLWSVLMYHKYKTSNISSYRDQSLHSSLQFISERINDPYAFTRLLLSFYDFTRPYVGEYIVSRRVCVNNIHCVWEDENKLYTLSGFTTGRTNGLHTFLSFISQCQLDSYNSTVDLLVSFGARTDVKVSHGRTALYYYIDNFSGTSTPIPKVFLRRGKDLENVDCQLNTPLMYAIIHNNIPAVVEIVRAIANETSLPSIPTARTPRDQFSFRNTSRMNVLDLAKISPFSREMIAALLPISPGAMKIFGGGPSMCLGCTVEKASVTFRCSHMYLCGSCASLHSSGRCSVCYSKV